mgnify:CR=1 FL=1
MINQVTVLGRLTRDPDMRYTPNGVAVTNFSIAVKRPYNREETDFFNVIAWRKLGENVASYMKKGGQIAVSGRLQSRSYETRSGEKRNTVEIVAENVQFLNNTENLNKKQSQSDPQNATQHQSQDTIPSGYVSPDEDVFGDDLPF